MYKREINFLFMRRCERHISITKLRADGLRDEESLSEKGESEEGKKL